MILGWMKPRRRWPLTVSSAAGDEGRAKEGGKYSVILVWCWGESCSSGTSTRGFSRLLEEEINFSCACSFMVKLWLGRAAAGGAGAVVECEGAGGEKEVRVWTKEGVPRSTEEGKAAVPF